ncbi:MAG: tetratricopeptide repeat protein [Candidatus Latescibacteria bacterium]|nr:tetratricopeptide repeat protein [Candidatus Latescibacterota bacterium]
MPEFLGPYQLKRLLGEGGMGQVYEALDRRDGSRVAVKLLRGGAMATDREKELFAREARAGMELEHPGLVRVLAVNIAEGVQPYLAMEYLPGPSLKGVLGEGGLAPLNALALAEAILDALAYVHRQGVVHRDIKTGNIMLDAAGRPRLMDFGLTTFGDETSLSRTGVVFGSPHYMSPEQGLGEGLDARSDLFSFCVTLFELLTGRLPFRGGNPLAVIYAIINEEPLPLRRLKPELPEALDWVLARGLAKRRPERYQSAEALADDLRQVTELLRGRRAPDALALSARPGRGTVGEELFPLPLVGRDDELAALQRALRGDGPPLHFLAGEAGAGKTRLVREAALRLGSAAPALLVGRTPPGREGFPYQPWLEALRPALESRELRSAANLAAFLARAGGASDGADARARLLHPFLAGEGGARIENRAQLFEGLRQLLAALAAEEPVAVWLEDLHRGDQASLDLLAFLSRGRPGELPPFLLSYRPEELSEEEGLEPLLRELKADGRAAVVELGRLSPAAVAELVAVALPGVAERERAAARLHVESGGNPFVLRELLQLLDSRARQADPDGATLAPDSLPTTTLDPDPERWELPLPERIVDLVEHRLAGLAPEERELLELAAVEGEAFSPEVLAAVLEERKLRVLRRLQGLERRTRLVQAREGRYLFDHAIVRRALYDGLGDSLRREYHLEVGEYLVRSGADQAENAAATARHFDAADEPRRALPFHLAAGRHARTLYAPRAARRHLERARDEADLWFLEDPQGEARGLRGDILRELGLLEQTEGRYDRAETLFSGAASLLTPMLDESRRAELERLRGECLHYAGQPEDAARAFATALTHCPNAARAERARILRSRAYMQARANRWDEALASCQAALLLSEGERADQMAIRHTLGTIHLQRGELETARTIFAEVVAEASRDEEQYLRTAALANLGTVLWRLGEADEALRCLEESRALRRRLGLVIEYAQILMNLAIIRTKTGELETARALLDESRELKERIGDAAGLASTENSLGTLAIRAGQLPKAIEHFRRAAALHRDGHNRARAAVALHNLGEALLDLGRLDEAAGPLAESRAVREELALEAALVSSLRAEARLASARGDVAGAGALFDAAAALAVSAGSPDEGLKVACDRLGHQLGCEGADVAAATLAALKAEHVPWPPAGMEFEFALLEARIARRQGAPAADAFAALLHEVDGARDPYRRLLLLRERLAGDGAADAALAAELDALSARPDFAWLSAVAEPPAT